MKNMFPIFFLFLVLVFPAGLFSSSKIDSLMQVEAAATGIEKIDAINKLAAEFYNGRDYDKQKEFAEKAYEMAVAAGYPHGESEALVSIADYYYDNLDVGKSLSHFHKAADLKQKIGDKKGLAYCYISMGNLYRMLEEFEKALGNFFKALELREELGDKRGIAAALNNLGIIYDNFNEYDSALKYYRRAVEIQEQINDFKGIAASYNNIGTVHKSKGDDEKALQAYLKAKTLSEKNNFSLGVVYATTNIGLIYEEKGEDDEALVSYEKALAISKENDDKYRIASTLSIIGDLYLKLEKYNIAEEYLQQSNDLAQKIGVTSLIQSNNYSFFLLNNALGEHKVALDYYVEYSSVKDSLYTDKKDNAILQLQRKYENRENEKEIELLKTNATLQEQVIQGNARIRNILIGIIGIVLVITGYVVRKYRENKRLSNQLGRQKREAEDSFDKLVKAQDAIIDLERKNSVLAMIVTANHEINQPLSVLSGNLELLSMSSSEGNLNVEQEGYLYTMEESLGKIVKLLEKYRDHGEINFKKYHEDVQMVVFDENK